MAGPLMTSVLFRTGSMTVSTNAQTAAVDRGRWNQDVHETEREREREWRSRIQPARSGTLKRLKG